MFSQTIDQVKGLAILLVVLGHISSPTGTFIFSFHMPLFFFLAGIFIKISYSSREYFAKGVERLIVPFLIFGALGLFATFIKDILLDRPLEPLQESFTGLLFWADTNHMHHYGFVLWFLPALFWGRIFIFFSVKHLQWHPAILVGASVIVAWLSAQYLTLPWGLDKGLVALPWIMLGVVFYQYHERWLSSGWYGITVLGILFALLIYFEGMQGLDLANKDIGNLLFSIPYTLSVILLLIGLLYQYDVHSTLHLKPVADVLVLFGQNTMLVMVLHVYTNNAVDIVVVHFLGSRLWFITFFLSVALIFIFIQIKRRYADSLIFKYL